MCKNNAELAEKLKSLNVPRKDISQLTGISYSTLSHWLNGFSNLTEEKRCKIEDAVKVYNGKMTKKAFEKKYNRVPHVSI